MLSNTIESLRDEAEGIEDNRAASFAYLLILEIEELRAEVAEWKRWWDQMPPGCGPKEDKT